MKNTVSGNHIVIIGSGIGGLSSGIILALARLQITIVEKIPCPVG